MGYTWVRFDNDNDVLSRVIGDPCWEGLVSTDTHTALGYLDLTMDFNNRVGEIWSRYVFEWKNKYKVPIQNAREMMDLQEKTAYFRLRGLMNRPDLHVGDPWVSTEDIEAYVSLPL